MSRHRRTRVDWTLVLAALAVLAILAAIFFLTNAGGFLAGGQPTGKVAAVKAALPITPALARTTPLAVAIVQPAKTPQIDSKGLASQPYPSYKVASQKPPTATTEPARATSAVPTPSATSKAPTPAPTPTITPSAPTSSASSPPTTAPAATPSATST